MFVTENLCKFASHIENNDIYWFWQYFAVSTLETALSLYLLHCCPFLSVCLSIVLTNPLCLGKIHKSCLTVRCHVYLGRSVLCKLRLALKAQLCLHTERRLQREREIQRNKHSQRKSAGEQLNCGLYRPSHYINCIYWQLAWWAGPLKLITEWTHLWNVTVLLWSGWVINC